MHLKERHRHNNPNTKGQNAHQISSQVANKWNGLPETPTLAVFLKGDQILHGPFEFTCRS